MRGLLSCWGLASGLDSPLSEASDGGPILCGLDSRAQPPRWSDRNANGPHSEVKPFAKTAGHHNVGDISSGTHKQAVPSGHLINRAEQLSARNLV